MDSETEEKVWKIKKDAEARVIDIMLKGMQEKKVRLEVEREEAIEKELERKNGWEAIKWVEKVDNYQQSCKEKAEQRKRKKMMGLQEARKEAGKGGEKKIQQKSERGGEWFEDEEEEEEERRVVESWESLVDEDKVREFGGKIYEKQESVESRIDELREVMEVFERYRLG